MGESLLIMHGVGATIALKGVRATDHFFTVPLNHRAAPPAGLPQDIEVFVREIAAPTKEVKPDPNYLLYLQGGPGYKANRPTENSGWIKHAISEGYSVLLLDQRGTGRSTGASLSYLQRLGAAELQASYLTHFRADSIVKDCELIREALGIDTWSILGQSFGGFCSLNYLSTCPASLKAAFITGGFAPLVHQQEAAEDGYDRLFQRVVTQNKKFYRRFPQDVQIVTQLSQKLLSMPDGCAPLPGGGRLTVRGLQALGIKLGTNSGAEGLHFMLEEAFDPDGEISDTFLSGFETSLSYHTDPLYVLLHESIYCQSGGSSRWAAERSYQKLLDTFDAQKSLADGRPIFFTGEMMFPFMLDEFSGFSPLKDAAHILSEHKWETDLYDVQALRQCKVPVASAVYVEDMYVDYDLAQQTASLIGADSDCPARLFVTNEYMHSGLREDGERVLGKLMNFLNGNEPER